MNPKTMFALALVAIMLLSLVVQNEAFVPKPKKLRNRKRESWDTSDCDKVVLIDSNNLCVFFFWYRGHRKDSTTCPRNICLRSVVKPGVVLNKFSQSQSPCYLDSSADKNNEELSNPNRHFASRIGILIDVLSGLFQYYIGWCCFLKFEIFLHKRSLLRGV